MRQALQQITRPITQPLVRLRRRLRLWARRQLLAAAAPAGVLTRVVLQAAPGLAGLAMLAYGAWLAWPPAGWMVAGAVVLVDVTWSRRPAAGRPPAGRSSA